jgi:hypothetical protein
VVEKERRTGEKPRVAAEATRTGEKPRVAAEATRTGERPWVVEKRGGVGKGPRRARTWGVAERTDYMDAFSARLS